MAVTHPLSLSVCILEEARIRETPSAEVNDCDRGYSVHGLLNFPRVHGRANIFLRMASPVSRDFRNDFATSVHGYTLLYAEQS